MKATNLLLAVLGTSAASSELGSGGSSFVPGATCAGIAPGASAMSAIAGKHLVIGELWWSPFAFKDDDGNWAGYNIDLMDNIAELLQITYEIKDGTMTCSNDPHSATLLTVAASHRSWQSATH